MPLLGSLFVNLFSGLVAAFTLYLSRKVAFAAAAVAAMSALTTALFIVFRGLMSAIASYAHGAPAIFMDALSMAVPPASVFCIATYMTMWTACTVYIWQRDLLHLAVKA